MLSFPQVLIDGELIGGFQETLRADQSGELRRRLQSAA
jgi:glutaredoxin 3